MNGTDRNRIILTTDSSGTAVENTAAKNMALSNMPNGNPSSAPLRYGDVPGALISRISGVSRGDMCRYGDAFSLRKYHR